VDRGVAADRYGLPCTRVEVGVRYTISLNDEEAAVLDALAHLNGYTGRPGAWVGDQVRLLVNRRSGDPDVKQLIQARAHYRQTHGRRTRHGLGVIDGGAA
jgi:hypothetical protein